MDAEVNPSPSQAANPEAFTADDLRQMVLRLAHEIRNPLATIKSGVQLVQHLTKPEGEIGEYLSSALTAVGRIDRTVRDMQRFVKIEQVRLMAVSVPDVVAGVVRGRSREAQDSNVPVMVASEQPALALSEQQYLHTAIDELLGNAIRFTPPGSTVMISWQEEGDRLMIHVDDEGPGIPGENQDRITRPFFSTSTQGTGLGLNIVARICRLSRASVTWRNLAGRGCRFTLSLLRS